MKKIIGIITIIAAVTLFAGCASAPQVSYGNPEQVETVTTGFGSTDLQMIAEKMANSLLASPVISKTQRPVLYVHKVKNMTDEHIDTKSITDKIKVTLLSSGRIRFSAVGEVNDEIMKQIEYQSKSGMVNPATAKAAGSQIGADYFLFGEISSIRKAAGRVEDVYFKITLNLVDIKTGIIEWADEKEIRKEAKKPLLGG